MMLEGTRIALFATASLSGNLLPTIPRDPDPSRRLLHLHALHATLPTLLADPDAPIPALASRWHQLLTENGNAEERRLVVRVLADFFVGCGEVGRRVAEAVVGSSLVALWEAAMGFAVEPRAFVVSCVQAIVTILLCMHENLEERHLVKVAERLKLVGIKELACSMAPLLESGLCESVKLCAVDAIALYADSYILVPRELALSRYKMYIKDAQVYTKELLYLAVYCFDPDSKETMEIAEYLLSVVEEAKISDNQLIVAFDSVNLSSLDYTLDTVFDAKYHDVSMPFDHLAFHKVFEKCGMQMRFYELMMENRFNLAQALKYVRLYLNFDNFDRFAIAELLVDLDDVVECAVNRHHLYDYLRIVNVFTLELSDSDNYQLIGAILTLLLPKLLHNDHAVRQLAFDNLTVLCKKTQLTNSTIRMLIEEYREHLMDTCRQQFKSPRLYPHAPRLLSAILHCLSDCINDVWSSVLLIDEILEQQRHQLDAEYLSSLVDLMSVSVNVAKKSKQIIMQKPRVTTCYEPTEDMEVERSYNDGIVERAFSAAFNLLSSDHGLVKKSSLQLMEQCCEYYKQRTDNRDAFLPMIHKQWDKLWCRLADPDKRVSNLACTTITMIATFDVGFCKSRFTNNKTLLQTTADRDKVVMLTAGVIEAGLEMDLRMVEQLIMRYPEMVERLANTIYGDIAWYHRSPC